MKRSDLGNMMKTIFISLLLLISPSVSEILSCGKPKHVHLAVGKDPSTSMSVSFASPPCETESNEPVGALIFGSSPNRLDWIVVEKSSPTQYRATFPLHNGTLQGNYTSNFLHHITIDGLEPWKRYYYRCIVLLDHLASAEKGKTENNIDEGRKLRGVTLKKETLTLGSPVSSFITAPSLGQYTDYRFSPHRIKFAFIGDMAQTNHTKDTMKVLSKKRRQYSGVIVAGDLAYPHHPEDWDSWFDMMAVYPVFSELPWLVAPGNHDIDLIESSGEIFVAYESRFLMPQIKDAVMKPYLSPEPLEMKAVPYPLEYDYGNAYYSFAYGPSHHIVLNSYTDFDPGSKQYEWLVRELEQVDRIATPWLLVTIHCPIYNTYHEHSDDVQLLKAKEHLEPLFVNHKVNIIMSGHIHAYMRTHPVVYGNVNATGPVHIVVGDGGRDASASFKTKQAEDWVAVRDATFYGYGTLEMVNRTHALWEWIHTGIERYNIQRSQGKTETATTDLPPCTADKAYITNQYYL